MSGPKISVYSLTGRVRAIAFGQIRCERQSLVCYAEIQKILKDIQLLSENFDQLINNAQLLIKRGIDGSEEAKRILNSKETILSKIQDVKRVLSAHVPHISAKYQLTEEALAEKQAELKAIQELKSQAETLRKGLEDVFGAEPKKAVHGESTDSQPELTHIQSDNERNIQKIQESIVEDLNGVYSFECDEDVPDTGFQDKKDTIRKKLSDLLNMKDLPHDLRDEIKQAFFSLQKIEAVEYLTTFDAVTVMSIIKKIDAFNYAEEQKRTKYEERYARYEVLCSMADETAKVLPYSRSVLETLNAEVERLELLLVRRQEQAYISECVDEVMTDMGYDLIGSREVHKKSGKHFRNELYTFNEGTAVNVTFAPDGQISMELGGLAREDRVPTSEETDILTKDMETFCGEFAEFERRMLVKGIVVGSRISLSPPTAEYAAIINVNDYDIAESTQVSVMSAAEKRRKQAEKKTMRKKGE